MKNIIEEVYFLRTPLIIVFFLITLPLPVYALRNDGVKSYADFMMDKYPELQGDHPKNIEITDLTSHSIQEFYPPP